MIYNNPTTNINSSAPQKYWLFRILQFNMITINLGSRGFSIGSFGVNVDGEDRE